MSICIKITFSFQYPNTNSLALSPLNVELILYFFRKKYLYEFEMYILHLPYSK